MAISDTTRTTLAELTARAADAEQQLADALAARDTAIRDALAAGAGISELARLAGLSRVTIYAIRDRRR